MIDRDTAIQWANFAEAHIMQLAIDGSGTLGEQVIIFSVSQLQSLITSIQNKAFEQAASIANGMMTPKEKPDDYNSWCQGTNEAADRIRALKQEQE